MTFFLCAANVLLRSLNDVAANNKKPMIKNILKMDGYRNRFINGSHLNKNALNGVASPIPAAMHSNDNKKTIQNFLSLLPNKLSTKNTSTMIPK